MAVAACVGSIESTGTTPEGIPVTRSAAREIATAYAISSARAQTRATGAIRATNASSAVADTSTPRTVAETRSRGRPAGELSTLSRNLLPCAGLALGK